MGKANDIRICEREQARDQKRDVERTSVELGGRRIIEKDMVIRTRFLKFELRGREPISWLRLEHCSEILIK